MTNLDPEPGTATDDMMPPTGPGAMCWCNCGQRIPGLTPDGRRPRSDTRFVDDDHKRRHHGRNPKDRPALVNDIAGLSPAEQTVILMRAALEAAVATEEDAARRVAEMADATRRLGEAELALQQVESPVRGDDGQSAAVHPLSGGTPDPLPAGVFRLFDRQDELVKMAISAERARVSSAERRARAAESQVAAVLDRFNWMAEQVFGLLSSALPSAWEGPLASASSAQDKSTGLDSGDQLDSPIAQESEGRSAVPYRGGVSARRPTAVVTMRIDHDGGGDTGACENPGRADLLTVDEAAELLSSTALAVAEAGRGQVDLRLLLQGQHPGDGAGEELLRAVFEHATTLEQLRRLGLGWLIGDILDGAESYGESAASTPVGTEDVAGGSDGHDGPWNGA